MGCKIIHGDCLDVMLDMESDSIDLIATDPPYNSGRDFKEYKDRWGGVNNFLDFIQPRIQEISRLLKPNGSFYLQCDQTASHYLKIILDEIIGVENFRNQIIWTYNKWSNNINNFQMNYDIILYYVKSDNFTFNQQRVECIGESYAYRRKRGFYPDGDRILVYNWDKFKKSDLYKDPENRKIVDRTKALEGKPMSNCWNDISYIHASGKERTGYPTQKPIALYERIIKASSNENDIVMDPFCGSGTTIAAAKNLNRRYIGIDENENAVEITNKRLSHAG